MFLDLTKVFDTVPRPMLWGILSKFGCPSKFLAVLRSLHEGARTSLVQSEEKFEWLPVAAGVRQGCVLASVNFNLFTAAVVMVAKRDIPTEDCFSMRYRLESSLINLRRLKVRTRTETSQVFDLQYADDAALAGSSRDGLQLSLDCISHTHEKAGFSMNTDKTKLMVQLQNQQPYTELTVQGKKLKLYRSLIT